MFPGSRLEKSTEIYIYRWINTTLIKNISRCLNSNGGSISELRWFDHSIILQTKRDRDILMNERKSTTIPQRNRESIPAYDWVILDELANSHSYCLGIT